jgi:hypothetical protein
LHGKGYSVEERRSFKRLIIQNIVDATIDLIRTQRLKSVECKEKTHTETHHQTELKLGENILESLLNCQQLLKYNLDDWNEYVSKYFKQISSVWSSNAKKREHPLQVDLVHHSGSQTFSDSIEL